MTFSQLKHITCALMVTLLLGSSLSWAGKAKVVGADNSRIRYEYTANMLRMDVDTDQSGAYMLMRDGEIYMVSVANGQPQVMNAKQVWSMAGQFGGNQQVPDMASTQIISMERTGKTEVHGGASGELYLFTVREGEAKPEQIEVVLSNDPAARGLMDAMIRFSSATAEAMGSKLRPQDNSMHNKIAGMNKGVLRFGKEFRVESLSTDSVASARFELPAKPTEMPNLGELFSGGQIDPETSGASQEDADKANSVLGGLMGALKASEEEAQKAEEDEEEQPASGSETVKEIGKTLKGLGGLFGK